MNENDKCYYCGGEQFETRRVKYIYSREGQYLFVPDMPAEVCLTCGMIYYDGQALLRVEKRFKAIHEGQDKPDRYANLPVMDYA
jgi:YgiT-type zinc finger domain-containing protein